MPDPERRVQIELLMADERSLNARPYSRSLVSSVRAADAG
jgi:hypothetical protein